MNWQWIALSLIGLFLFGLGYIWGLERGVKAARNMAYEDCEKLGGFYIGKRTFRCLEINQEQNND